MKRWFYILLGGLGVCLSLVAAFLLWQSPWIPPGDQVLVTVLEYAAIPVGIGLACLGWINGKRAGEFDIAAYVKSSRKRDHHVSGSEIDFECPVCHKGYRASPLLEGRPFTCRECQQVFNVSEKSDRPRPEDDMRLLPGPS
jgi:hypothetical protein